mmetsp:Transcript_103376/g.287838  ORF Transcript_103376/g.287838 Transcript_103376/m.287838 type:complete len:249 (+) Transcript_103376:813-1559(+)
MEVDSGVRCTGNAGTNNVNDANGECLELLRNADCLQGVRCLATLRNGYYDILSRDQGPSIAELACILHLHGKLREALKGTFRNHSRVERRSASTEDDAVGGRHPLQRSPAALSCVLWGLLEATELQLPGPRRRAAVASAGVEPASQGVPKRIRLVHDLLQHEVCITCLFNLLQGHLEPHYGVLVVAWPRADLRHTPGCFCTAEQFVTGPSDLDKLTITEVDDVLRVLNDRGRITGQHVLTTANAKNEW